jgi:hypothetical protein
VYNPFSRSLVLDAGVTKGIPGQGMGRLRVSDISGRTVFTSSITKTSPLSFDLPGIPAGVYHVKVLYGDSEYAGNFILVK